MVIIIFSYFIIKPDTDPTPTSNIAVAATIFPLADIAQNVAGDSATVVQLLPAGASPHAHTLTPQQLTTVQDAQALFAIGHGLDDQTIRSLTQVTNIPTHIVDANISLRQFDEPHHHDHQPTDAATSIDPHYWLSVPNAQQIAINVSQVLQSIDPANHANYQQNLDNYLQQLVQLESQLQNQAASLSQPKFVAIHDAWSYFADQYNLQLIATYEPVEGREPSVTDIRNFQQAVTDNNISTFYTEPQKQSSSVTRFLQEDLGLTIKILDPIGGTSEHTSYIKLMQANMAALFS